MDVGEQKIQLFKHFVYTKQRCGILRSSKKCRHCILGLKHSANLKLESQNLTHYSVYSVHCPEGGGLRVKFWYSSLK
jgi:hypothetical protein